MPESNVFQAAKGLKVSPDCAKPALTACLLADNLRGYTLCHGSTHIDSYDIVGCPGVQTARQGCRLSDL